MNQNPNERNDNMSPCSCGGCCPLFCPCVCRCPGPPGEAATIEVGTVTTGEPGTPAEVTNVGTSQNAVLDFTIPAGEAATIEVGTVTTGEPGTPAEVVNVGTAQNAVLDFTIPAGESGGETAPQFLSAYSTPAQTANSGDALIFDRNALANGSAVTHQNNASDIVIQQTGYYQVSFHGTVSPARCTSFPLPVLLYLEQNQSALPGAAAQHNFQSLNDNEIYTFSRIIRVDSVPTSLKVVVQGGPAFYDTISITVLRLGDL